MTSELIVDVQPKEVSIALLEDKRLVEFSRTERSEQFSVGNIYLARVRKIMPGLNACFVSIGHPHDAFLHYLDLGIHYRRLEKYLESLTPQHTPSMAKSAGVPDLPKEGNVSEILNVGQELLVQISKEPINTKGPRLTCEISFAGRLLCLIPFGNKISISTKIRRTSERNRLKQLIASMKPAGFSVIMRTACEGKNAEELDAELTELLDRWSQTIERVKAHRAAQKPYKKGAPLPPAQLVQEEQSRVVGMLRDLFNPSYEAIHVGGDRQVYEEVYAYVEQIAPDRKNIVKHYTGNVPIFDNYNVTKQIKGGFGRIVTFKHGAYLVIETTEALHVVDVNSGNRARQATDQEEGALDVNLGAADELARQLRLRDMGGIIVVDFIDMEEAESRQKLYERMVENLSRDRAKHNVLPLSKFGLMQITRQRIRQAVDVNVEETCPTCGGEGKIKTSLLLAETIERQIYQLTRTYRKRGIRLHVHPYVEAYLKKGFCSIACKWKSRYGLGLKIIPNQSLGMLQYKFFDSRNVEIDLDQLAAESGNT
ncbi:MAG: Rne/Rng family ribonuclease [Prevotellaceae bacterium]|nr:Rne/Rng family ribonuclease [Prevotellaceae bacterium]